MIRGFIAAVVSFTLIAGTVLPAQASMAVAPPPDPGYLRAMAALNAPCEVAQLDPTATAAPAASTAPNAGPTSGSSDDEDSGPLPSPSPSTAASHVPLPVMPRGPGVLVPPPLPASPSPTPPPLVTPSPDASTSPGPQYLAPASPLPTASYTPAPVQTAGPIKAGVRASPTPSPAPSPGETLGPNDYAVLGDKLTGNRTPGHPFDLDGHVNVIYADGVLAGDHGHYDGTRYIDITGNTYIQNREGDSTLTADSVRFDTLTQRAVLINGRGITTQGVDTGRLHFSAQQLTSEPSGVVHGVHATLTTCERPKAGYHLEARTLDVTPGDKAVLHSVTLFLGGLAVFWLPLVVIPLRQAGNTGVRRTGLIPLIGYSDAEGFYIKARIGFGTTNYYYGYYRVEYYTKIGYGLGYVASFRRKDGKRSIDVDAFRLYNKLDGSDQWNVNFGDQEVISPALRATARYTYQSDYGPLISLPANTSLALGLTKSTAKDSENYSFARQSTGGQNTSDNYGLTDTYTFSSKLSNATTVSYTSNTSTFDDISEESSTLHFNTDTHYTTPGIDYDFIIDRYDSATPNGVNKLPELLVRPHGSLFSHFFGIPNTATFTLGEYSDPLAALATGRFEAQFNLGPVLYHLPIGDFNGTVTVRQDDYGTGDEKAQVEQQFNITTPFSNHFQNILSYSNQHVNGLGNEPFTFDTIGGAYKNLQEVLKVYNGDTYALSLQTGTAFNMQAQPISYQLLVRPTQFTSMIIGGNWSPGAGRGFDRTNVQLDTPIGRGSDIQFSTFVDWKTKGRLESKQIYYRRIIGDCYEMRVSYNEDLKTVNLTFDILAFPSQALNFGLGQQTSIVPQSFATSQFFGGQN